LTKELNIKHLKAKYNFEQNWKFLYLSQVKQNAILKTSMPTLIFILFLFDPDVFTEGLTNELNIKNL